MSDSGMVEKSSLASERADFLRAMAEKWHDAETLGDATCDHRELEIHAFIAGYSAASAGSEQEIARLRMALNQVRVCIELQRDVVERGRHAKAWNPVIGVIKEALGEQS